MNSSITFDDKGLFDIAVTALEIDATPQYDVDPSSLMIYSDDIDGILDILHDNGIFNFSVYRGSEMREDNFRNDVEADADALASAGYGTDEDYGGSNDHYEDYE